MATYKGVALKQNDDSTVRLLCGAETEFEALAV